MAELSKWLFSNKHHRGYIIYSVPGVGKSSILRAIKQALLIATAQRIVYLENIHFVSLNKAKAIHLKSNFQSGIDFSFSDPNHYLIDGLCEKLNNLKTFSYKHSLIDHFKTVTKSNKNTESTLL